MAATLLTAVLAVPSAAVADHPCGSAGTAARSEVLVAGAYEGGCVGGFAGFPMFQCVQVIWGVHTGVAGVGGHNGCAAHAYVVLP